jgi:hypothetical protein
MQALDIIITLIALLYFPALIGVGWLSYRAGIKRGAAIANSSFATFKVLFQHRSITDDHASASAPLSLAPPRTKLN